MYLLGSCCFRFLIVSSASIVRLQDVHFLDLWRTFGRWLLFGVFDDFPIGFSHSNNFLYFSREGWNSNFKNLCLEKQSGRMTDIDTKKITNGLGNAQNIALWDLSLIFLLIFFVFFLLLFLRVWKRHWKHKRKSWENTFWFVFTGFVLFSLSSRGCVEFFDKFFRQCTCSNIWPWKFFENIRNWNFYDWRRKLSIWLAVRYSSGFAMGWGPSINALMPVPLSAGVFWTPGRSGRKSESVSFSFFWQNLWYACFNP